MTRNLVLAAVLSLAMLALPAVPASAARHAAHDWNASGGEAAGPAYVTVTGQAVAAGDTLLAYAEGGGTSFTMSGCGQSWTRLAQVNAQQGVTEVWEGSGTAASSCAVTATLTWTIDPSAHLTVADYGATGAPSVTAAHGASGAAAISVTGVPSGSALTMSGNDFDGATARTLLSGDTMVSQYLPSSGDTYWTEQAASPSGNVTIGTSAPAAHQWNAIAVTIPPLTMPAAPSGLTVTGTTSSTASLSWTAPGGTVTGYYVYRGGIRVATVTSGTGYTDTGLAVSTTYSYAVSAFNGAGEGPRSGAVQATTRPAGSCPSSQANTPGGPDPQGGCFPSSANTGVPAGITPVTVNSSAQNPPDPALPSDNQGWAFSDSDGYINVTAPGAVIDGVSSTGVAVPAGDSLTMINSHMDGIINDLGSGQVTVRHSSLNGGAQGTFPVVNASSGNATVLYSDLSGGKDEVLCNGGCDIENSWLHDNYNCQSCHQQAFASEGGSSYVLRHDSLYCTGGCTADVYFSNDGQQSGATVTGNLLVASPDSAFCVYPGPNASPPSPDPSPVNNMVWQNNVFQKGANGTCATYGPVYGWYPSDGTGNIWSGNTWDDGTPLNE